MILFALFAIRETHISRDNHASYTMQLWDRLVRWFRHSFVGWLRKWAEGSGEWRLGYRDGVIQIQIVMTGSSSPERWWHTRWGVWLYYLTKIWVLGELCPCWMVQLPASTTRALEGLATLRAPGLATLTDRIRRLHVFPMAGVVDACLGTFPRVKRWELNRPECVPPADLDRAFRALTRAGAPMVHCVSGSEPECEFEPGLERELERDSSMIRLSTTDRSVVCMAQIISLASRYFDCLVLEANLWPGSLDDSERRALAQARHDVGRFRRLCLSGDTHDPFVRCCLDGFAGDHLEVELRLLPGIVSLPSTCRALTVVHRGVNKSADEWMRPSLASLTARFPMVRTVLISVFQDVVAHQAELVLDVVRRIAPYVETLRLHVHAGEHLPKFADPYSYRYLVTRRALLETLRSLRFPYLRSCDLGDFGALDPDDCAFDAYRTRMMYRSQLLFWKIAQREFLRKEVAAAAAAHL